MNMKQGDHDDHVDIGSKLRSAQACISLAAELLSNPDILAHYGPAEIYRFERQLRLTRNKIFSTGYFGDVAWEVMVDLFVAGNDHRKLSIADLADRNKVPLSTLLRYLAAMEEDGLIYRIPDHHDRRRVFIKLTQSAEEKLRNTAEDTRSVFGHEGSISVPMSPN